MESDKTICPVQYKSMPLFEPIRNPIDDLVVHADRKYLLEKVPELEVLLEILYYDKKCVADNAFFGKKLKVEKDKEITEGLTVGILQPMFKLNDEYKFVVIDMLVCQNVVALKELAEYAFKVSDCKT